MSQSIAIAGDLGRALAITAVVIAALSMGLLAVELVRASKARAGAALVATSGLLAVAALLLAVLRPVAVRSKGTSIGPKIVVLADASRSIDLPGDAGTRRAAAEAALAGLLQRSSDVRASVLTFGDGAPKPLFEPGKAPRAGSPPPPFQPKPLQRSDLSAALEAIARSPDERPAAIVVISDGRLDRPGEAAPGEAAKIALGALDVPVHTVGLASKAPADASIRKVLAAGAAVAHQPFSLRVEIGCDGGLSCDEIPIVARELRDKEPPVELTRGVAKVTAGLAAVELAITIERAGARILEVEIEAPRGDTIPENNKRFVTLDVTRDRIRVLHVAGRPTYDVRALRTWLKSDASVDVIAFFILRTPTDDVNATQDELALIPFPVDELFTEQLPTFDAVVLQDFNAAPYGLTKHLPHLARYVDKGGGLIMVGGPDSFIGGNYAGTAIAAAMPVDLDADTRAEAADPAAFVPVFTEAGRAAPVLAPLRALLGDELPEMPGANVLGDARGDAAVLLAHPTRKTKRGAPMPVLALGEHGAGRTMALGIDGSHRLLFSAFAATAAGRAHGAFWDAMLGWLMRDPRFEPASMELVGGGCLAGEEAKLLLRPLAGQRGEAEVAIMKLGSGDLVTKVRATLDGGGAPVELSLGALPVGGYQALAEIGKGVSKKGATTRRDFACEKGGDEWADTRPDEARLRAIAKATGGAYVPASEAQSVPLPASMEVALERQVTPILPPWAWALGAACLLGAHWIIRRRTGLT